MDVMLMHANAEDKDQPIMQKKRHTFKARKGFLVNSLNLIPFQFQRI